MSPEPSLDATGIARRQFSTSRKGNDPAEVRAFLHEVSDLVGRLQRSEAHERERAERAEQRAKLAEQLDEHRLVELLGEETARVLEAAREAAADIRSHAEESAARLVREAQVEARALIEQADADAAVRRSELLAEADALRHEAEEEVERRRIEGTRLADDMRRVAEQERERMLAEGERARAEAEAAAEQIRASAREQGRHLVGEAQVVRERMLGDLSRRRRMAREQLERLNGARERLLAAYAVVKRTVDEATTELTVALPEARAASEQAMRRVSDEPEESVEVLEAELSVARMSGLDDDVASATVSDDELDAMLRELAEEEAAQAAAAAARAEAEAEADAAAQAEAGAESAARSEAHADPRDGAAAGPVHLEDTGRDDARGGAGADTPHDAPVDTAHGRSEAAGTADDTARDTAGASAHGTGGDVADKGASRGAGPRADAGAVSDGDKWGIRLPRSRPPAPGGAPAPAAPSASGARGERGPASVRPPVRAAGDAPAPVPTAAPREVPAASPASAAPTGGSAPVAEDKDEGESGPYVDELFARIRAERGPGESPDQTAPPPAASTQHEGGAQRGAVAVAVRAEPDAAHRSGTVPPAAAPEPRASAANGTAVAPGTTRARAGEQRVHDDADRADDDTEVDEPVDPATRLLQTRDTQLAAVERELGRKLKRVLADEQNEVLDMLRRGGAIGFADVVPAADEHVDRFAIAATAHLESAAAQGAELVGGTSSISCDELAATLGRTLVEPLRVRIERSFDDSDGDLEEVGERLRALYREWKGNHIGNAVRHFSASAHAQGAYLATPSGAALQWLVDRSCDACPDCDDNALAGRVVKGEAYPTGDRCAPAHPDCRCLVVPADLLDDD
jgi:cell division septum initiation protein DivIVA